MFNSSALGRGQSDACLVSPPPRGKEPVDWEGIPGGGWGASEEPQGLRPAASPKPLCELLAGGMWLHLLHDS